MLKQLSIAIVAISHLSGYSAEAVEPGGACDFLGEYLRENDTNGAYHLLCDGNQYNLNLTLHKDGPVGIGTINPSSGLKLDVEGKVGATDYCDENGENCFTAGGVRGGSAAAAGPEGAIQFNNLGDLSGSNSFVYTSAGRVGIGTDIPAVQLEVVGDVLIRKVSQVGLTLSPNNPHNEKSFILLTEGDNLYGGRLYIDGGNTFKIQSYNAGVFKDSINIDYGASVSFSENVTFLKSLSTSEFRMLDHGGYALLQVGNSNSDTNARLDIARRLTTSASIAEMNVLSDKTFFSGTVGIGTNTPSLGSGGQLRLDIEGPVGATQYCDQDGNNCFTAANVGNAVGPNRSIQFNNSSALGGNANFVYTADGRVGIGTSDPSDVLEVVGNIQTISNPGYIGVGQTASRPITNMFYHSATGNAGFGVNLYYNGTNWVYANTLGHGMAWRMFPSSRLSLYHAGNGANPAVVTELFTVTNGGNVGIGKSNPAYPLDVVGDIALTGQIHDASDRRLKDNIKPLNAGQLKKLAALQGVSFVMQGSEQTELGLIAQDVEPHFPELVQTRPDGMKTLSYLGFIAPMIEAFKEQQTQLEFLQEQVEQLQSQLRQISSQDQPE